MQRLPPDARRLLSEILSVYVACDDCGREREISISRLREIQALGIHTYGDLCRKVRCGECPRLPVRNRNLTIRPRWRTLENYAGVDLKQLRKDDFVNRKNLACG